MFEKQAGVFYHEVASKTFLEKRVSIEFITIML